MTSKEAYQARLETTLELGARSLDQEGQMWSKETCKARSEVALELGAKMSNVLKHSKDKSFRKLMKIGKNAKSQKGGKEESIAEGQPSSYP